MENNNKKDNYYNYLRPMVVQQILYDRTDENHFLTAGEIIDIMQNEYDVNATRQTLYADIDRLIEFGCDIECVRCRQNKYHVVSRDFDLAELRIIIDVIESSKSLPPSRSQNLVRKIADLAGPFASEDLMKTVNIAARTKSDNNQVYYIIDVINQAITKKKQIVFRYYAHIMDKKKVSGNNEEDYRVSPYRTVWSGEFYYLIGFSEKHKKIVSFRVDRISGVPDIVDMEAIPMPEDFSVSDYLSDAFSLRGGEKACVDLIFRAEVLDALIDRFGNEMSVVTQQGGYCTCSVDVTVNNVFFAWVFGFEGKVRIAAPQSVKMDYVRMVSAEMARL